MASYMDDFKSGAVMAIPQTVKDIYGGYQNLRKRGITGVAGDVASVAKEVVPGLLYGSEGRPAVKPTNTTPSASLRGMIEDAAGTSVINKIAAKPPAAQAPAYMSRVNAPAAPAPSPVVAAPVSVDPQAARIKAYQDFMSGSLQRGKEAMARWKGQDGARMASPKAREEFARQAQREGAQMAQANVAGEREAGVERFKAEKAAEGMVGAKQAAAAGEEAGIRLKGEYDVKAAEAKAGAMEGKDRAKMLKDYSMTLANSEPGSPAYQAAEAGLAELYGQKAAGVQEGATATGKDGKKIKYVGGKWIPA